MNRSTFPESPGCAGDWLGPQGAFATRMAGFTPRAGQVALAEQVETVLRDGGVLVAEAGTGIGKTYAYLVPALQAHSRVVISTATRALQDQLFLRDLPAVTRIMGRPVRIAILKGRGNYLCLHRHAQHHFDLVSGSDPLAAKIDEWLRSTRSGDLAEIPDLPERSAIRYFVTSTVDNCLGGDCPRYNDCFVARARKQAQEADIVIVNHHLLVADLALRDEGFGRVVGEADAIIVDEAHALPDIAREYLGERVSFNQCRRLIRDLKAEVEKLMGAGPARCLASVQEIEQLLQRSVDQPPGRASWPKAGQQLWDLEQSLCRAVDALVTELAEIDSPDLELTQIRRRAEACAKLLDDFAAHAGGNDESAAEASDVIRWVDVSSTGMTFRCVPAEPSDQIGAWLSHASRSWALLSATLAVGDDLSAFMRRLGRDADIEQIIPSPFDYHRQGLLYMPESLPPVEAPDYVKTMSDLAAELIEVAKGRAFILFTSHQALREAAEYLRERLAAFPLFVQGDGDRQRLLDAFRESGRGVLLGTASFWEGVDVKGEALSLVVIHRLPFASPGDPVWANLIERTKRSGGNPFMELQLPRAVMALKQGAGRLIRDHADYGMLVICDPRLHSRSYGRLFLKSLPPFRRTHSHEEALRFLAALPVGAEAS